MERLPYIDAHGVDVAADVGTTWVALVRVVRDGLGGGGAESLLGRALRVEPRHASGRWSPDLEPGAALAGFTVERVRRAELLSLRGRHRFSRYRLDFELAPAEPAEPAESGETGTRTHVRARTWAEFPGLAGAAYRALVIRSGGHGVAVRRMLRRVAAVAAAASVEAPDHRIEPGPVYRGAGMQLTRDHVASVLRKAGYWDVAEFAESSLPDLAELDQVAEFLQRHGVTHDELISQFGGSP